MTWGEDDRWTSEVALSPGTYDFKLVIVRDENGTVAAWEPGENRSVTVRSQSEGPAAPMRRRVEGCYIRTGRTHQLTGPY